MKRLVVFLMVLGLVIGVSGLAQADISWYTQPVLGYDLNYNGNVNVITTTGTVVIPYTDYPGYGPQSDGTSMTVFTVGQSVFTGSGVNFSGTGTYNISMIFTDLTQGSRSQTWLETLNTGDGFLMLMNSPALYTGSPAFYDGGGVGGFYDGRVGGLSNLDIGNWKYVETITDAGNLNNSITSERLFTVTGVPEPATMLLLGLGLMGLAGIRRKLRS